MVIEDRFTSKLFYFENKNNFKLYIKSLLLKYKKKKKSHNNLNWDENFMSVGI